MSRGAVYTAGPMKECTDEEMNGWRRDLEKSVYAFYSEEDVKFLHPTRRDYRKRVDQVISREYEDISDFHLALDGLDTEIVEKDKKDIRASDVIYASCWKESTGTTAEIIFAYVYSIPSIVLVPSLKDASSWLRYHAGFITDVPEEAFDELCNVLDSLVMKAYIV